MKESLYMGGTKKKRAGGTFQKQKIKNCFDNVATWQEKKRGDVGDGVIAALALD